MSYCSDVKIRLKSKRLTEIVKKLDEYVKSKPEGYHENVARQFDHFEVIDVAPDNDDVYVELTYYSAKWYWSDVEEFMKLVRDSEDYAYARIGEEPSDVEREWEGEIDPIYIRSTFDSDYEVENVDEDKKKETDAAIYKNIFKY